MRKCLWLMLAAFGLFVLAAPAVAQEVDYALPAPGELRELRSDDVRCPEGFRCFTVGRALPRQSVSAQDILNRVNRDIGDPSRYVSMAQFEDANQCRVIYALESGSLLRNGSCPGNNGTTARITWEETCDGNSCRRWLIASAVPERLTVYRVPAERHLTPGERAEEMVRRLDGTTVTETVPAPAEMGSWLIEYSDLMNEENKPSYEQLQQLIGAVGRTLTRASAAAGTGSTTTAPSAVHDMDFTIGDSTAGGAPPESAAMPSDEPGSHLTGATTEPSPLPSTTPAAATPSGSDPFYWLWLLLALSSGALSMHFFMDLLVWPRRRRTIEQKEGFRQQDLVLKLQGKIDEFMGVWNARMGNIAFSPKAFGVLFDEYEKAGKKIEALQKELSDLKAKPAPAPVVQTKVEVKHVPVADPETTKRVLDLERQLREAIVAKEAAESIQLQRQSMDAKEIKESIRLGHELEESKAERVVEKTDLERRLQEARDEADQHGNVITICEELLTQFHTEGMAHIDARIEQTLGMLYREPPDQDLVLASVEQLKALFEIVRDGVYAELMKLVAPALVLVPAGGPRELENEPTVHRVIPGFGGAPPAEDGGLPSLAPTDTMPGVAAPTRDAPNAEGLSRRERKRRKKDAQNVQPRRPTQPFLGGNGQLEGAKPITDEEAAALAPPKVPSVDPSSGNGTGEEPEPSTHVRATGGPGSHDLFGDSGESGDTGTIRKAGES